MKLSVIMSVYNGGPHLAEAIESVLGQTFRDFEFLIVNDGSTDQTGAMLADYASRDARINVLERPDNQGLTASLNGLLAQAKGEYLARMDADDVCLPERFATQVAWLDAHPACGMVGSAYRFIDLKGSRGLMFRFENDHHYLQWYLCFQNPLAHPSVMGRTALFRSVGGYREQYRYGQDFDLWWRMSFSTQLGCLPEPLVYVRRNPAGVSGIHRSEQVLAKHQILNEMAPKLGVSGLQDITGEDSCLKQIEFIRKVYESFASRQEIPEHTRMLIRRDAAMRLALIFLQHPAVSTAVLASALKMDPAMPLRGVRSIVNRLVSRIALNPIIR